MRANRAQINIGLSSFKVALQPQDELFSSMNFANICRLGCALVSQENK